MSELRFVEYSTGKCALQHRQWLGAGGRNYTDWADVERVEAYRVGLEPSISITSNELLHDLHKSQVPEENGIHHGPFPNPDKKQEEDTPVSELTLEQRLSFLESSRIILFDRIFKIQEQMSDGNCLGDDSTRPFPDPGNTRPGQFSDFTARLSKGVTSDPEFTDKPLKIFPPLVSADRELINVMKDRIEDHRDHYITLQTMCDRVCVENRRLKAKLSLCGGDVVKSAKGGSRG